MPRSKKPPSTGKPAVRRINIAIALTTLGFLLFTALTIRDLLQPANFSEVVANSIPILLSILGLVAILLSWRGKDRAAGILMILGLTFGMILVPIYTEVSSIPEAAATIVVVLPIMIALQTLSEREFPVVVILSLLARAAIQWLDTFDPNASIVVVATPTEATAQWLTALFVLIFLVFVGLNMRNYAFRTKMILVLGLLTIVPLSILTGISRTNLERTLIEEANQSLVLSASQMASSVDAYIQLNLDGVRTETQLPDIVAYLSQTTGIRRNQLLLERGTPLEASALEVLYAIARKDPINIQSVRLMDRSGLIQLSTDPDEINLQFLAADYLSRPYNTGLPYLSPPRVTADGEQIHFSAPVRSTAGDRAGVLDIVYSAKVFQQLMVRNSARLGPDVSALLLDEARVIVAHSESPESLFKVANPESPTEVMQLVMDGRLPDLAPEEIQVELSGLSEGLANAAANPVFAGELDPEPGGETTVEQAAIASLQSAEWKLVTFIPQSILLAPVQVQTRNLVVISILISLAAIAAALGLTQLLVAPILGLARTSERIAHGDVEATADVRTKDEIGYLADGFNIMTARLRDLITGLEERVAERTQALERRAVQLQAAADVGSTAARLRDLDELLRQVTRLISQRFGFYHVGIFLLDERSEYAVLRAANSEGGQRMLGRGHKLKVGQVGIVGFVAATGQPRMASDVDEDTEFFNNPDLPLTHSEMALPMIAGKKTLGVLDVQSTQQAAFSEEDITTLKVLADQLVIAIENARLFTENQNALDAARRAYGQMGREGWQRLLRETRTDLGFISLGEEEVRPASGDVSPELIQTLRAGEPVLGSSAATLYLPVQVRGQGIGAIRLDKKAARGSWSDEDVALARALAEQLGTALESARLYNDISQRAEREFAISEIVSKIGSSIQLDTILRTTVQELGQVLGDTEVILQLGTSGKGKKGNHRE